MSENPGDAGRKKFYNKCFENSRSQTTFLPDISSSENWRKLPLIYPTIFKKVAEVLTTNNAK